MFSQHVIPSKGKWAVKKYGSYKFTKLFSTKEEAIIRAKNIAIKHKADVYIHNENGSVLKVIKTDSAKRKS